jgi:branched-chain amino acid transport system permease protein
MKAFLNLSLWGLLIVVAAAALLPIALQAPSMREEFFLMLMVVVLASSVNIIIGYTGYVSFGHIVYFGLGGYIAFYLMHTLGMHFALAALVGGLGTSVLAMLIGIPVLRLRGAYFALATIGINEAVRTFVTNFEPFGASVGMFFNFSVYDAYGGAKAAGEQAYYAMIVVALAVITASFVIKKSKFGLGLMAIREDQDTAMVLGVNPLRAKVTTYSISAFFPALAGAIFFFKNGIIEPGTAFELLRSIESLVMVMLGGYGTVAGPVVGAVLYEQLRTRLITSDIFSSLHLFIAGALLLVIVLFVTAGVIGWLRQQFPLVRRYVE